MSLYEQGRLKVKSCQTVRQAGLDFDRETFACFANLLKSTRVWRYGFKDLGRICAALCREEVSRRGAVV